MRSETERGGEGGSWPALRQSLGLSAASLARIVSGKRGLRLRLMAVETGPRP
jgi:hypothetical protein